MSVLLQLIYRLNAFPVRGVRIFGGGIEIDKLILKFLRKCRRPRIANAVLEKEKKKNKVGGLTTLYFNTYFKATVIKTGIDVKTDK